MVWITTTWKFYFIGIHKLHTAGMSSIILFERWQTKVGEIYKSMQTSEKVCKLSCNISVQGYY